MERAARGALLVSIRSIGLVAVETAKVVTRPTAA